MACSRSRCLFLLSLAILLAGPYAAAAGGWTPKWDPTYNMQRSTIVMPCNYSGYFNATFLGQFGIVDFDWSNAKMLWANAQPMDCEERLVTQAQMVKSISPDTKVFVYRNLVKALPWFTNVREKITNPDFSGWFVPFKANHTPFVPACTAGKCSNLYHDQEQTPHYPSQCLHDCDCGSVPCGEYLWDHRNASLTQYLVNEVVLGPTGLGSPYVDGFYFDDGWSDQSDPILPWMPKQGFCDHNEYGGPTEVEVHCINDTGLDKQDVAQVTEGWRQTMQAVYTTVQEHGAFAWQMFSTVSVPNATQCAAWMRGACAGAYVNSTMMMPFTKNPNGDPFPLINFPQDLAAFLLARGPYAWIGYAWLGCSSGSEPPGAGSPPAHGPYEFPAELKGDYGVPQGLCHESAQGVFERQWTKATVRMDCNTYQGSIVPN